MNTLQVHVDSTQNMAQRFVQAFQRAAAGDIFKERHITFLSLDAMLATMTPKRLELLRHLHRSSAESVSALARSLNRDYKRVHEDVAVLEASGLIVREENRLTAPWDTLATEVAL